MFDNWTPVDLIEVYGDTAHVLEHKKGEYRVRKVDLENE